MQLIFVVCVEMDKLSTTELDSNEEKVNAFTQVLQCTSAEAQFFLESSNWNIEVAVLLFLDNNSGNNLSRHASIRNRISEDEEERIHRQYLGSPRLAHTDKKVWQPREVIISGLEDSEWGARVSRTSGGIYFYHKETGLRQFQVPPGFADRNDEDDSMHVFDEHTNASIIDTNTSAQIEYVGVDVDIDADADADVHVDTDEDVVADVEAYNAESMNVHNSFKISNPVDQELPCVNESISSFDD